MLRVIDNHRKAAKSQKDGYIGLAVKPIPLDADNCQIKILFDWREKRGTMLIAWVKNMAIVTHKLP